ncbi:Lrp/AsnC family transcriptional regulator [Arthrobacter sp. B3I4]|uniref:Lrp/AsnC family transcriptional regulator n=1 Tax=Arthrobacter sp. B3I4 TaxID=3042267 RepID=UPI0027896A3E|nr:Lrp/AsnC family transcriptional regulator [Arthrobacter sp. B3I4]MDQ0756034.1 DNA-binding Lrp family transcriptional regulator [Arthrobacter sp. B3I4]
MKETDAAPSLVQEPVIFAELDLALVNALQLQPRASWVDLAGPLGTTATTLARRWDRLSKAGLAWVTASFGPEFARSRCISYVMIRSEPAERTSVVEQLAQCPEVATIEVATGGHDINCDVLTLDLRDLDRFLTEKVHGVRGVISVSILLTTSLYLEGSRWRLRSLDQDQLNVLNKSTMSRTQGNYVNHLDGLDRSLLGHLANDGRLSWAELASLTDASTATVRRRVNKLISSGIVTFRCELAHSLAGWPIQASLLAQTPAADVDRICRVLAAWPECRFLAAVTGTANVYATFWVRDLGELQRLEARTSGHFPSLTVVHRMVALNTPKRMGHLCDDEGRRTGTVPISPW